MSEKKKESSLSLSAKAKKFDVPLGTLKKVFRRGVAAWNSGHRPGTTPQQWGHARVNSFLRKGKTYHTADKDLREDAEQLNELKKETLQSYLEKRRAPKISDIARAETVGKPEERQKDIERANLTRIGRARAKRKLQRIDRAENPQELVQQHHDIHHPYASRVPGVPDKPGSVYWGDHVEHEDVNQLFERLLFLDADPEQAAAASELEKSGKSPEQIWKEKGAFKDPYTGKWTKEISDKQMDLPHFEPQSGLVKSDKKAYPILAQGAIKHDELFKQVPGVKATQVTTQSITPVERVFSNFPYRGQYSGADLRRGYRPPSIHTITTTKQGALDVMAHELQHNVDDLQNRLNPSKYDFSQNKLSMLSRHSVDPNEVRANATMSRRELDDKQRRERFPLKDYKLGASLFGGKVGVPLTMVPKSLREMQLVGTDEYRQHAIAMTPGQDQEIEDVFPPEEYGTQVYEPASQEEPANAESDGSVESGVDNASGNSFRAIRKKLQEQEVEELEDEEQIEGEEEEEEGENDGAEDGVDFTPNLKTTKARKYVPQVSAADSVSGFPVLGIAESLFGNRRPTSPPRPPVSRTSNILRNVSRNAGRISTGTTVVGAGAKAAAGDYSGAATDAALQAGQSAAAKLATKKAATMTAKFVSKAAARKLPLGLGLAATGAGVADRLRSRDYLGAAGEGLSGLAGTVPGIGTAVSAGIDTALLGRDLKNLQAQTQQKKKPTLAEAVDYHQENNISLIENAFRPGSEMFFAMILEAKRQYAEGTYVPKDEYEQDLLESDIGEVAEFNGETVLLDFPYEELEEDCWDGYEQKGMKKKGKKMVPNCVPVNEEVDQINETMNTIYPHRYHGSIGPSDTGDHVYSFYVPEKGTSRRHTYSVSITNVPGNPDGKTGNLSFDYNGRQPKNYSPITGDDIEYLKMHTSGDVGVTGKGGGKASAIISTVRAIAQKHAREYGLSNIEFGANWLEPSRIKLYDRITSRLGGKNMGIEDEDSPYVKYSVPVNEEKDPTRGKGIGKPFRSRGGGAVYVRNEKGNIIKVNFSQSGMKKRFNEPARVKSFVARHNCYGNKDKTSASYWACRWPRYFSDSGQQWW